MNSYLQEVYYLLGNDRHRLPWMILMFLGLSILDLAGLSLIVPYVSLVLDPNSLDGTLGRVVELASLPKDRDATLITLGSVLVAIFLIKTMAAIWANRSIIRFCQQQQIRLRSFLMQAYQNMPYTDYLHRNSSEYIHGIQQLAAQFSNGVVVTLLRMLSDSIVALIIIVYLAWINCLALMLMVGLFGSLALGYDRIFRRSLHTYGQRANDASVKLVKGINEGIEGFKEIRILGKELHFHSMVRTGAEEYATNAVRSQVIASAPRFLLELMLISFVVLLVFITLNFGGNLQTLGPMLALFGIASLRLLPSINNLSNGLIQLRTNRHAVSKLYDDLKQIQASDGQIRKQISNKRVIEPFATLRIDNIHFRYANASRKAIEGISLEIKAGESIGFIGTSGSGKTTLVDVILGLLEPQKGKIFYNDKPLHEALEQWRSHVAYLPQQIFIIDNTLKCNVALGVPENEIDDARLQEALRQASLAEVADQLPQGMNTMLGEHGVRLSGGQRQRVALARAFYHGRDVLVMDEATSALDNETEHEIIGEIQQLKGRKTMIIIAHRLSTVEHCDRICRLEKGKIVCSGSPQEVLFNHQMLVSEN